MCVQCFGQCRQNAVATINGGTARFPQLPPEWLHFPLWVDSTLLSEVHLVPLGITVSTINGVFLPSISKAKDLGWPYFQFIQTSATHPPEK